MPPLIPKWRPERRQRQAITVADTSKGFHTYGVNCRPMSITWYVDGAAVATAATPADMHKPMYNAAESRRRRGGILAGRHGCHDAERRAHAHRLMCMPIPASPRLDISAPSGVPALTLGKIVGGVGVAAGASIAGKAATGVLVELYDGASLIGTTTADAATGAFAQLFPDLGGTHSLSAKVAGSASSTSVTVVVGTSADIVKQMPSLQTMSNLAGSC